MTLVTDPRHKLHPRRTGGFHSEHEHNTATSNLRESSSGPPSSKAAHVMWLCKADIEGLKS